MDKNITGPIIDSSIMDNNLDKEEEKEDIQPTIIQNQIEDFDQTTVRLDPASNLID